jgi:hypothetical protein
MKSPKVQNLQLAAIADEVTVARGNSKEDIS